MMLHIPNVVTGEALADIRQRLDAAQWGDGKVTAGPQSGAVKRNLQLATDGVEAREIGTMVLQALDRSALFRSAALPARICPPLFNKYAPGMDFGSHIDNAIRGLGPGVMPIRTDISATLFLSDPASYQGGELVIEDAYQQPAIKLAAGDMFLYPATSRHLVRAVTSGERVACFFWVQSLVKDAGERALLFDLDQTIQRLSADLGANREEVLRLTGHYHNLVRKWGAP